MVIKKKNKNQALLKSKYLLLISQLFKTFAHNSQLFKP